jgi:hypothetical protein
MIETNEDLGVYLHLIYQGKTYYLSDSAKTTTFTYFPFLANSPSITYGGEGFVRVKTGNISILRYVEDYPNIHINDHPFAEDRYLDLLTSVQEIPFELYLGSDYIPLFKGTLALSAVTENILDFSVMEEEFEENLVYSVLDQERVLTNDIFLYEVDGEKRVMVEMLDNSFTTNDTIIFERKNPTSIFHFDDLIYTKRNNNQYIVTDRTTSYFFLYKVNYPDEYVLMEDLNLNENDLTEYTNHGYTELVNTLYRLSTDSQEYFVGAPTANPFSFGEVKIKSPVVRSGSTDYSETNNYYLIRNPGLDTSKTINIYDDGIDVTSNIVAQATNSEYIALSATPVGEIGITGISAEGTTAQEFFTMICSYLNGTKLNRPETSTDPREQLADIYKLDAIPDFSLAPNASIHTIPVYKDAEITAYELASEVAKSINYIIYIQRYRDQNREIRGKLVVVDMNEALFNNSVHSSVLNVINQEYVIEEIDESYQIKIDIGYDFPIKSLESTITINRLYDASANATRDQSIMKPQDLTYRFNINKIGNIESENTFANTVTEGKYWLERKSKTKTLPIAKVELRDIRNDLTIGKKVRVIDRVRSVMIDLMINEVGFDFSTRKTTISGPSQIKDQLIY